MRFGTRSPPQRLLWSTFSGSLLNGVVFVSLVPRAYFSLGNAEQPEAL